MVCFHSLQHIWTTESTGMERLFLEATQNYVVNYKDQTVIFLSQTDNISVNYTFPFEHALLAGTNMYRSFEEALAGYAKDGNVILIMVDYSYVDLAINLYLFSFAPLDLMNHLFVCMDHKAYNVLCSLGFNAYLYKDDPIGDVAAVWGTDKFAKKAQRKMEIVQKALSFNYRVLQMDADIVMYRSPFPYFTCPACDLEMQDDAHDNISFRNTGFYYAKPTRANLKMLDIAQDIAKTMPRDGDQPIINKAINQLGNDIKVRLFNSDDFPTGCKLGYLTGEMPRMSTPVIVHNNCLYGLDVKINKFKQHNEWRVVKS